ncbi:MULTISPECIES: hypothetical protein [unclassified Luteimonas]
MNKSLVKTAIVIGLAGLLGMPALARSQVSSIDYGRVTAVQPAPANSRSSSNTGAIVGGMIGMSSGRGQRGANRAARTAAGAGVGHAIGNSGNSSRPGNFFTVRLVGGGDVRVLSDQGDIRVNDCVSVERGDFNNIRRVGSVFCETPTAAAFGDHRREADQCLAARRDLESARGDAFDRAVVRVRAVCDD